jgi:quinol monooxygenase YgiN
MILMTIRMKVLPEKRKELHQTLVSLTGRIRTQKGCGRCDFCISAEDENDFSLLGEGESRENLASHLESNLFKVLLGAGSLLKNPHEMKLYTSSLVPASPALIEEATALRAGVGMKKNRLGFLSKTYQA